MRVGSSTTAAWSESEASFTSPSRLCASDAFQQHLHSGSVNLRDQGEIENQLRTVSRKKRTHVAKKFSRCARVHALRHSFYDDRPAIDVHISSLQPCWGTCGKPQYRRRKFQIQRPYPARATSSVAWPEGQLSLLFSRRTCLGKPALAGT